jgi:carboxylate-amine ligase
MSQTGTATMMIGTVTDAYSIGVEEEFLLAQRSATRLSPASRTVIEAAELMGVRLFKELTTAQVETNTSVCWNIRELRRDLVELRSVAAAAASRAGARLLAAGAPMTDEPPAPLADSPRYQRMARGFGMLAADHGVCGCHVHVGLADRETAILVGNHLRLWLPTLLALSANSAIHRGRDTGYASWRTVLWGRWPCAGPPPYFTSAGHFDSVVTMLRDAGAILDSEMIYWDIRPSAHQPTIEIRVSDVPSTVDETVLLAALVRGLVATAVRELDTGRPARVATEVLRAAYWRSAHDGIRGHVLDPVTFRRVTFAERLAELIRHVSGALEEQGDLHEVTALANIVLSQGNGALRQRHALARRGEVADVVDDVAMNTLRGLSPSAVGSPLTGDHAGTGSA